MSSETVDLGYLAQPDTGEAPGVVMIHDVWGLSEHTRDMADRLAVEGFSVLALDLYRREAEVRIENPAVWMRRLSDPQVLADVQTGIDFLATRTGGRKIGVLGFCMGGMYALMASCTCAGLSAGVPFYGLLSHEHGLLYDEQGLDESRKPRQPLDLAAELGCPLLAFFGEDDEFIPLSDVRALEQGLAASDQPAEVIVFPGAGHAFMNDTRPEAFRPEVAALAWRRTLAFLDEKLRAGAPPRAGS
jgi:carboxymethylenebutenolidase